MDIHIHPYRYMHIPKQYKKKHDLAGVRAALEHLCDLYSQLEDYNRVVHPTS